MLFSSIDFIFLFLPVFMLIYWLVPDKYANAALFLGSIIFYAFGEHVYFILIIISLLIHFMLTKFSYGKSLACRRVCLAIMLLYGFGTLFIFKYMGFFQTNWNHLAVYLADNGFSVKLPVLDLPEISLPIGISFYTFQISAYAIDVYRGNVKPEKKFIDLGAFLCMFPQLIAGPIVLYSDVAGQLKRRVRSWRHVENGLKVFIIGLSLKVILANTFGGLWNQVQTWGVSSVSVALAWLGVLAYTLQIYFDFQGYSLMAMGLGEVLGFRIPRNFRHPYTAVTVTDFWRRWHITLSSWFKNYVYIPLGGSRCSKVRMIFNMFIVWAFTGLWHGASWNFVLWGMYYFVLLVFEKIILLPLLEFIKKKVQAGRNKKSDHKTSETKGASGYAQPEASVAASAQSEASAASSVQSETLTASVTASAQPEASAASSVQSETLTASVAASAQPEALAAGSAQSEASNVISASVEISGNLTNNTEAIESLSDPSQEKVIDSLSDSSQEKSIESISDSSQEKSIESLSDPSQEKSIESISDPSQEKKTESLSDQSEGKTSGGLIFGLGKILGWCYTFIVVMTGWAIFAIDDLGSVKEYLVRMFCYLGQKEAWLLGSDTVLLVLKQYGPYFAAGAFFCTALPFSFFKKHKKNPFMILILLALFGVCVYKLNSSASNPFLYFRF